MIPEPDWTAELEALLERLIDGEFDAADRTRLNVLLAQGEAPRPAQTHIGAVVC